MKNKKATKSGGKKSVRHPSATDVWARTQMLVEILLKVMEKEIRARKSKPERSEQWIKLFGPKDSAVVNLQKLVQLLAELQMQSQPAHDDAESEMARVSEEELAILSAWLKETSAANVSTVLE